MKKNFNLVGVLACLAVAAGLFVGQHQLVRLAKKRRIPLPALFVCSPHADSCATIDGVFTSARNSLKKKYPPYPPLKELLAGIDGTVHYKQARKLPDPRGRAPAGGLLPTSAPQWLLILVNSSWDSFENDRIRVWVYLRRNYYWHNGEPIPVYLEVVCDKGVKFSLDIQKQGTLSFLDDTLKIVPGTLTESVEDVTRDVTKHRINFKVMTTEAFKVDDKQKLMSNVNHFELSLRLMYALDVKEGETPAWRTLETGITDITVCQVAGQSDSLDQDTSPLPLREPWACFPLKLGGAFAIVFALFINRAWLDFVGWLFKRCPLKPAESAWRAFLPVLARGAKQWRVDEIVRIEDITRETLLLLQNEKLDRLEKKNAKRLKQPGKKLLPLPERISYRSVTKEAMQRNYGDAPKSKLIARFLTICEDIRYGVEQSPVTDEQIAKRQELADLLAQIIAVPGELKHSIKRLSKRRWV
jgi:hypothetical protein